VSLIQWSIKRFASSFWNGVVHPSLTISQCYRRCVRKPLSQVVLRIFGSCNARLRHAILSSRRLGLGFDWLDVEAVAPTSATISIELSESKPAEPPAEHDVGSAPISVEGATKDEIAESETAPEVTESSAVEYPHLSSEAPQFIEPTEQAHVTLEDHPHVTAGTRVGRNAPLTSADIHLPVAHRRIMGETAVHRAPILSRSANLSIAGITGEARVGDKTLLASASVNVSVARENQPLVTADARVENQIWPVLAIGSVFVPVEEQPYITAEALVGAQTPPFSASANVSAELATKDNVGSAPSLPKVGTRVRILLKCRKMEAYQAASARPHSLRWKFPCRKKLRLPRLNGRSRVTIAPLCKTPLYRLRSLKIQIRSNILYSRRGQSRPLYRTPIGRV
jgi:hypothetical protein